MVLTEYSLLKNRYLSTRVAVQILYKSVVGSNLESACTGVTLQNRRRGRGFGAPRLWVGPYRYVLPLEIWRQITCALHATYYGCAPTIAVIDVRPAAPPI